MRYVLIILFYNFLHVPLSDASFLRQTALEDEERRDAQLISSPLLLKERVSIHRIAVSEEKSESYPIPFSLKNHSAVLSAQGEDKSAPTSSHDTGFLAYVSIFCNDALDQEREKAYQKLLQSALTFGDKDQYESADWILTHGKASERESVQNVLMKIVANRLDCEDEALLSLWVNGDEIFRDLIRALMRDRALSGKDQAYTFMEALFVHGNTDDRRWLSSQKVFDSTIDEDHDL